MDPVCAAHPGCVDIAAYILEGADDTSGRGETLNFLSRACCPTADGEMLACCVGGGPSSGPSAVILATTTASIAGAVGDAAEEGDPLPGILVGGSGILAGVLLVVLVAVGGYVSAKWEKERELRAEEEWRRTHPVSTPRRGSDTPRRSPSGSERGGGGSERGSNRLAGSERGGVMPASGGGIALASPRSLEEAGYGGRKVMAIVPASASDEGGIIAVPAVLPPRDYCIAHLPGANPETGELCDSARPPGGHAGGVVDGGGQAWAAPVPAGAPPPLCGSPPNHLKGPVFGIGAGGCTGAASSSSGTPSTQASSHHASSIHASTQASSLTSASRTSRSGSKPRAEPVVAAQGGHRDPRTMRAPSPGLNRNGLCSLNLAGPLARPSAG